MSVLKPLLLLDVDGPLNPWPLITKKGYLPPKTTAGEEPYLFEKNRLFPTGWERDGLDVLLSPQMGADLAALSEVFTLVWATTWGEDANRIVAPLIGLPTLPVIEWPDVGPSRENWTRFPNHRGSWKTKHIARWLDGHATSPDPDRPGETVRIPWVWIDDDIRRDDRLWLRDHYGETKGAVSVVERWLLHVAATHGLRRSDILALRDWADRISTVD